MTPCVCSGYWIEPLLPPRSKIHDHFSLNAAVLLGCGGFSHVVQGKDKESGKRVAVKIIKKDAYPYAKREIEFLEVLNHVRVDL